MTEPNDTSAVSGSDSVDGGDPTTTARRDLLKKIGIGAGVAGVVWTSPRIEGLSMRQDYAAAQTAGDTPPIDVPIPPFDQNFPIDGGGTPSPYSQSGNGAPNLAYGYGWNAFGGPGVTDFAMATASDCVANADATFDGAIPAPDAIVSGAGPDPAPFPNARITTYSWGSIQPPNNGTLVVHFAC